MTRSREQLILEAIKTRLEDTALGPIPKPAGLTVERSRLREFHASQLPAMAIYPMSSDLERKGYLMEGTLQVKVAIYVKSSGSAPIDEDLDAFDLWAHQQLVTDESLGGLCLGLQLTQKIWGFALYQGRFGDLDLHYTITYRHQYENPSLG